MASSSTRFSWSHTTTRHSRYDSPERVISSSQRPLPDNTHNRKIIHTTGGIQTNDRCRRAAVDLRLRPRGHWDRHKKKCILVVKLETLSKNACTWIKCHNPKEEPFLFHLIVPTMNSSTYGCGSGVNLRVLHLRTPWIALFFPDTVKVAHSVEIDRDIRLVIQTWRLRSDKRHLRVKYMRFLGRRATWAQKVGPK
jgi:hypothetical protein